MHHEYVPSRLRLGVLPLRSHMACQTPPERGLQGAGTVHHVAWSAADDAELLEFRAKAAGAGAHATQIIDRQYFHSVYFREPSGVLFELATDGPGFAVDEDPAHLGESLVLPPWLEPQRTAIERALPALEAPQEQYR